MKYLCKNPVEVCKEAFWLAWNACGGPIGMGILQNRPNATRSDIWEHVTGQKAGDYVLPKGEKYSPYADYLFGRMMKIGFTIHDDGIEIRNNDPTPDYQGWCSKFPTTLDLLKAADKNING